MKCPKCEYLGFETTPTCRNCGYDFSLASDDTTSAFDVAPADERAPADDDWLGALDTTLATPSRHERALPLFTPNADVDDEPLIKLPAAPRAPLSVRRTPETPRLRTMPKPVRRTPEPAFEFGDEPALLGSEVEPLPDRHALGGSAEPRSSGAGARLGAAIVDHAILLAVDLAVVYFTLKIAALPLSEWEQLPLPPLLAFLLLLELAYFAAFTAVGGQTIGKMGFGIRVVADDNRAIDPARALRRSLAGGVSLATLGAAFAPALFGAERRALHDRVAGTRVVAL